MNLDVADIRAGESFSCALTMDGGVRCWGYNGFSQLGDNTTGVSFLPVVAAVPEPVVSIAPGGYHVCALTAAGEVYCWGSSNVGESGGTAGSTVRIPAKVTGATGVVALGTSVSSSFAVERDGGVLWWGENQLSGLSATAQPFPMTEPAKSVTTNWWHACAVLQSGRLECWGRAMEGQLGFDAGSVGTLRGQVPGLSTVIDACAGMKHTCAVIMDGGVLCWGDNTYGQLGTGNYAPSPTPLQVGLLPAAHAVACHERETCAATVQGVYCWGDNAAGQLGSPTPPSTTSPLLVPVP